ncbi:MAG: isochorismatase [Pusillimonas sp.]|nr:isochorismatase [Pusillimonas sp.]
MHKIQLNPELVERSRGHRGRVLAFHRIDPSKTAHLIIDMQNGFVEPGGAVEIPLARDIVPNINKVSAEVRRAGGVNVFLRFTYDETEATPWTVWYNVIASPESKRASAEAFWEGAHGHQLWSKLDVQDDDLIVNKTRFSGFTPGTSELDRILKERGIETVIISGTMSNCCSESTARDAQQMNYQVVFLADANATLTDEEHNATLNNVQTLFGDVIMADDVSGLWA